MDTPERRDVRLPLLVTASFRARLDAWRAKQPDLPSRNEAIMRLAGQALDGVVIRHELNVTAPHPSVTLGPMGSAPGSRLKGAKR